MEVSRYLVNVSCMNCGHDITIGIEQGVTVRQYFQTPLRKLSILERMIDTKKDNTFQGICICPICLCKGTICTWLNNDHLLVEKQDSLDYYILTS